MVVGHVSSSIINHFRFIVDPEASLNGKAWKNCPLESFITLDRPTRHIAVKQIKLPLSKFTIHDRRAIIQYRAYVRTQPGLIEHQLIHIKSNQNTASLLQHVVVHKKNTHSFQRLDKGVIFHICSFWWKGSRFHCGLLSILLLFLDVDDVHNLYFIWFDYIFNDLTVVYKPITVLLMIAVFRLLQVES